MTDITQNNKRIAKNTLLLYLRMFFIMAVTLFTSRVVLKTLGVVDFGIYNVVGGVVAMMGILNGAMSVSTQRYLTFELGKNDILKLRQVFSMCLTIFALLSLVILVLAETIGLWFLNTRMVIPDDRIVAANWVYQFSILSCIFSLLTNPYNATIIARERMNVYAYVGVLEVMLKFGVVYLLLIIPVDRLEMYGCLILLSQVIVSFSYIIYCVKHFPESRYYFYWDKSLFKELISYSGWNLFGSISGLVKSQGLNILLNLFFNPTVNAARGIAYQVNAAISQFFTNFYTAVRPQITKYYAQKDLENMFILVFRSSKMSYFLILLISLPIIIETPFIIDLWLGQLPDYVVSFVRLIVIITAVDAMASPLMTTAHATGKIAFYQFSVGSVTMLNIPISYFLLYTGGEPTIVFIVSLCLSVFNLFLRLWIVKRLVDFPVVRYIKDVIMISFIVTVVALLIPLICYLYLDDNVLNSIIICFLAVFSVLFSAYFIGLNHLEKNVLNELVKKKLLKKL